MTKEEINTIVEDILTTLPDEYKKDLNKDKLTEELNKFLDYGVPLQQAKTTLIKKYGGNTTPTETSTPSTEGPQQIQDIQGNQQSVSTLARIIHIAPKDITVKGEAKTIYYGILGDPTGTIPFTAWNDWKLEKGDTIEISNAYSKEWQGNPQLNFGDRTTINKTDADALPDYSAEPQELNIKDLKEGLRNITLTAKILTKETRKVSTKNGEKTIISGALADTTGVINYNCWTDKDDHPDITEDSIVKINGGYIKSWRSIPQFTFDDSTQITVTKDKTLEQLDSTPTQQKQLYELTDNAAGGLNITTQATILEVRAGSGLILRCPECNRALKSDTNECSIHGEVKGSEDLRLKLTVDDGTGAATAILNKELTEQLLGKTLAQLKKSYKNKTELEQLSDLNTQLFSKHLSTTGNALTDDYGTTLIVQSADLHTVDVKAESEHLIETLNTKEEA